MLQQRLRRKRNRHPRAYPQLYSPPPSLQIFLPISIRFHTHFSTPHLRRRPVPNHRRSKELLPHAAAARRLAEEDRVRDDRVPV